MEMHKSKRPNIGGNRQINSALALSLAGTMLLAPFHSASAEEAKTAPANTQTASASENTVMKMSQDAFDAMRAIHDARIAIFNGEPKLCGEMLNKAGESLTAASKDETVAKIQGDMIPIDGSLSLADTFVSSEKKAEHIGKANEHFKKGESKKGIEELKLGEIDVNFSRVLISLDATKRRLADAQGFAKKHKYYECNLALKAAEDAVVVDSVILLEFPKTQPKTPASAKKPEAKEKT